MPAIYVAAERDNSNNGVSRCSVLRFDSSTVGTTLTATHEWNLTADLPVLGANLGLEAITWIPDTYLVAQGFVDGSTNQLYNPALHPDHGTGLFFVGVEANGLIYGYALNHTNSTFTRVATISSGQAGVMGIEFDRDTGNLWAHCDNTCGNRATVLRIAAGMQPTPGHFVVRAGYSRPGTMPDVNNEGLALAPESECVAGRKTVIWSDDNATGGFSIRRGSVNCGPLP